MSTEDHPTSRRPDLDYIRAIFARPKNKLHRASVRKYYFLLLLLLACLVFSFLSLVAHGLADSTRPFRTSLPKSNDAHHGNILENEDMTTLPTSFWSSLDLNGEINCGEYKCLFRQTQNHEQIAYLVGNNFHGYQFGEEWEMTWKLARYLQSTFQIKHLYLEAPKKVMVPSTAVDLFTNRTQRKRAQEPMYTGGHFAAVQKVRLAPNPRIIMTTTLRKWTTFKWLYRRRAANKTSFVSTLRDDVAFTLNALEAIPLLANDFQIMIDSNGNIWHFDLDRVFFHYKFAKAYNESKVILGKLSAWTYHEQGSDEEDTKSKTRDIRNGDTILVEYARNFSSLSCSALDAVNTMSGRKESNKEIPREEKLMMAHMIQKMMFDVRQDDEPRENKNGSCSL